MYQTTRYGKMMAPQMVEYLNILEENTRKHFTKHYPTLDIPHYEVEPGRKYNKVVQVDNQRIVHSFVDNEGNVYKAAGWRAPAKGVRYNLNTDLDVLRNVADPFGSYLYLRGV